MYIRGMYGSLPINYAADSYGYVYGVAKINGMNYILAKMNTENLRSPIPPQSRISEKKPLNYSDADSLPTNIEKDYYEESPYRFYIVMAYFLLTFTKY